MMKFTVAIEFGFYNDECEWFFDNTDDLKNFLDELIANHITNFNVYATYRFDL